MPARRRCDIIKLHLIGGLKTNLRAILDQDPLRFRQIQRKVADNIHLHQWDAAVPELYAEEPTTSRVGDDVPLRTWSSDSVGTTRLPVGLVRLVKQVPRPSHEESMAADWWDPTSCHVALWPDGAGTINLGFELHQVAGLDFSRLREEINSRRSEYTAEALRSAKQAVDATIQGLKAAECGYHLSPAPPVRIVGRHRLMRIGASPTEDLLRAVRRDIVLIGRSDEFADLCDDEGRFCYAGNGVSVEIAQDIDAFPSLLAPVLEYYEYWIAATTTMDDELYSEFSRLSRVGVSTDYRNDDALENAAQELFFTNQDVLNAMSPRHMAAWKGLLPTWRVPALERDIREKILAIEELNRSLREKQANRVARRTSALVTFLTALTLVSLVTGVAAFALKAERLTPTLRIWLVVVSSLAALLLFFLSFRPVMIARSRRPRA